MPLFFANNSLFFLDANSSKCQEMARCIQRYCLASRQMVNLEKLNIIFSSNVPCEIKAKIEAMLGVKATINPCTYLGIPTL